MRNEPENSKEAADDYTARVNRAIDHIVRHLDQPLNLDEIARVGGFSPFHFHRIFRTLLGETLNQFVKRVRLERALQLLSHGRRQTLTEIALACGFGSSSDFSRSFKKRYGVSPRDFDLETFRATRRGQLHEQVAKAQNKHHITAPDAGENPDGFTVHIRDLPERQVAYLRVLDPYRPDVVMEAAGTLVDWAQQRGLAGGQWLGYMWDDAEIVAQKDCRYDVGVEVENVEPEGSIGVLTFPAMTVAQIEIRGTIELEMRAIEWMYSTWLQSSGYVPIDQPAFEAWIGLPFAHGTQHFELFMQLPVERA